MIKAVEGYEGVVDPNNNSILGEEEDVNTSEEQKPASGLEEEKKCFGNMTRGFNVPLNIFHYKDYDSDFFTSWYNVSSEIFNEISRACPEKRVLNLSLSVLMLPYIAFTALGLVVYNGFKTHTKAQANAEESKTKKSEISESMQKRLAYGVLAAITILVNIAVLVVLIIPATLALATFYLLNRKSFHSLIAAVKISSRSYQGKHQSIGVSFREIDAGKSNVRLGMEIKLPPQFEQLLKDLSEDKDGRWFDVIRDSENNTILKLSANIHLKNGLVPLHNEIRSVIAISIQEFEKAMEELLKLEKKDITYDKLKKLLNEFILNVVNSVDSKLVNYLIQDAYRAALIQTIKIAQGRRKKDFSLEETLKEVLVKQELKSQGKELPTAKEMIIKDLKELKMKEALNLDDEDDQLESLVKIGDITNDISDNAFSVFKAKWEQLKEEGKIAKRTIVDIYRDVYHKETAGALAMVEELKGIGEERCRKVYKELKEVYENGKNGDLKDGALRRKLEDLFKFECDNQEIEQKLIDSRIRAIQSLLRKSDDKVKQSLTKEFDELEKKKTSDEVNNFMEKMYLEITKCRMQSLFERQAKDIKDSCDLLEKDAPSLVERINSHRIRIEEYLRRPGQLILLKKIIEGKKDLNKYLEDKQNSKGKEHPNIRLIKLHLENNEAILEALEQLELYKEGLLINEETKNNYKEELTSREKIKFAIIEDELLEVFKHETFDEEAIKKLLEKAELEYCLAEKCIEYPVIETKDNIKHFYRDLLSPLINRLVENIINNVPKSDKSPFLQPMKSFWTCYGYIKTGLVTALRGNRSIEGKALDVAHNTYKEVETFLQYFESNYEETGALVGNIFSDNGKTFKDVVWTKIKDHLCRMWDRFFKDIEFTPVSSELSEVNVIQPQQKVPAV
ncbi:hypothetical protein [Wolbachia pipientis]|uniref:hypothetical protein n=1 Tax=Wolbachia pipientis TaxID=955 RepID=UPI0025A34492|nr:hypothetical protein [Wolbachia pipientis]MDM8334890.1 hypothetical protein [Wolbachia pipientis]